MQQLSDYTHDEPRLIYKQVVYPLHKHVKKKKKESIVPYQLNLEKRSLG